MCFDLVGKNNNLENIIKFVIEFFFSTHVELLKIH